MKVENIGEDEDDKHEAEIRIGWNWNFYTLERNLNDHKFQSRADGISPTFFRSKLVKIEEIDGEGLAGNLCKFIESFSKLDH